MSFAGNLADTGLVRTLLLFLLMTILSAPVRSAKLSGASGGVRKPIVFSGVVESIDPKMRTVAVHHGEIPGFMPPMTMDYPVEDRFPLERVRPGDRIRAIVYVGDPTLHQLEVLPAATGERTGKAVR